MLNDISSSLMIRQRALPELKRYLLHCVQPYRTPRVARERNEVENGGGLDAIGNIQKRHETWCEIKAAMNCRNLKNSKATRDVSHSKIYQSGARLAALQ